MIKIITDSTSDISTQQAKDMGVEVIPLSIAFGDESYKDGIDIDIADFYEKLAGSKNLPSTSQPSPDDFLPIFNSIMESGDSAVCILLSGKLSGTVQSATIAKQIVAYPDIHIVDSKNAAVGIRILVDQAIKMREDGMDASSIADTLLGLVDRVKFYAMVDTLEYLYKGGRLSRTAKIAGTFLGFKPVLELKDGELKLLGKARGVKRALELLLDYVDKSPALEPGVPYYFGYTATTDKCDILRAMAHKRYSFDNECISPVGGAIGTHGGPGACVIGYLTVE